MNLSINHFVVALLIVTKITDAQDGFCVQSGNWYLRVGDDGSGAISPGMGFRPGIAAGLNRGSIDAASYKEKLRKLLKPGPVLMNGATPRIPLEVRIIEGDKIITGTVNDGRIWNEIMETVLPQAYPDRTAGSVWEQYIEKRRPFLPLSRPSEESKEVNQEEPDRAEGADETEKNHGPETSEATEPPSTSTGTQARLNTKATTAASPSSPVDLLPQAGWWQPWFVGLAFVTVVGIGLLWMWLKRWK